MVFQMSLYPNFAGKVNRIKAACCETELRSMRKTMFFSVFGLLFSFVQGHPLPTKVPHAEGHLAVFLQKQPLFTLASLLLTEVPVFGGANMPAGTASLSQPALNQLSYLSCEE